MKLWIFEKPSVAKTVAKHLAKPHKTHDGYIETGDGYVSWCVGHVLELCPPDAYDPKYGLFPWKFEDLPIIPEKWKLQVSESKKKQVSVLKKLLKECTSVVNGGDEGREGQLLVDEVIYYFGCKKPVERILLNAMDDTAVKRAINNLQDNKKFYSYYESALGRSRADWLIGMNFTRAYTIFAKEQNYKGILSVGRVQTPTIAIVAKRDEEIANFIPKDYFTISAIFEERTNHKDFVTRWLPPGQTIESAKKQEMLDSGAEEDDDDDVSSTNSPTQKPTWLDEKNRIIDKKEAEKIVAKVKAAGVGVVTKYINRPAEEQAPLPFELTGLQIALNRKHGFSPQQTLDACQNLYEKGFTTYPRTDCSYLPTAQLPDVDDVLAAISQASGKLAPFTAKADKTIKSKAWNDAKLGEHHAIIPTRVAPDFSSLSDIEKKAYELISQHYVAQFYPNCKVDKANIEVTIAEERFAASGRVVKDAGWRVIFSGDASQKEESKDKEPTLPVLTQNENVDCTKAIVEDKKTTPPPHFTPATLLDAMKNVHRMVDDPEEKKKLKAVEGIGRSATRAGIIETLYKRGYLINQGKFVISSDVARILVKALPPRLIDPGMTAKWEYFLDGIANGKFKLADFESNQIKFVNALLKDAKQSVLPALPEQQNSYSAPSKSGSSSGAKKSSGSSSAPKKGKTCPKCGKGTMIQREVKAGANKGKKFLGCTNYPACNHSEWPKK